jgi:hypothetical protein
MYSISFRCGHEAIFSPASGLEELLSILGLTSADVIWEETLIDTSATGLMMVGWADRDCDECQSLIFVGEKNGYVAVYSTLPREGSEPMHVTDIPLARLPDDMQQNIRRGIMLQNEEELQRFLEGIDR